MYTRKHRKIKVRSRKYLKKPSKAKRRKLKKQKTKKMKRYMGGAPEKAPATGQPGFDPLAQLTGAVKENEGLSDELDRVTRLGKITQSALGVIVKAAQPNKRAKLKDLKSNIKEENKTLQEMTTRENERSAKEKEKIQKQQKKVDEIQDKIDELEGTSSTGKPSTSTSPGSTGMKVPPPSSAPMTAKGPMPPRALMGAM